MQETRKLKVGNADMLSDSEESQFFRLLLKSIGAKKAIEIGEICLYTTQLHRSVSLL